jgi:thiamine kinase-like enzyme
MDRATRNRLDRALASWQTWPLPLPAPPRAVAEVPGGRTNLNVRLEAPGLGSDLLLRLNHPEPHRLGIDRDQEREILNLTADAGITRPYRHWDPDGQFVLFEWIEARPWNEADLASPDQQKRLWPLIERLCELELDRPRRRYAAYLDHYWRQLERSGSAGETLRDRWQTFRPRLASFDRAPWTARLVHHDLVPANILESSRGLYLIDWEYAAPGHPDIDRWSIDPGTAKEPFIAELMTWIIDLWERLAAAN